VDRQIGGGLRGGEERGERGGGDHAKTMRLAPCRRRRPGEREVGEASTERSLGARE
jgi:hypothetical protein